MKRRVFLFAVGFALPFVGCSKDEEIREVADRRRGDAKPQLQRFEQIAQRAATRDKITTAVKLQQPVALNFKEYKGNVAVLHLEDMKDTSRPPSAPLAISYGSTPNEIGQLLRTGKWAGIENPKIVQSSFEQMLAIEHILLLRTHRYRPAKRTGKTTFEAASYQGDALLYRLEDGRFLGGFPLEFGSSKEMVLKVRRLARSKVGFEEDFDKKMKTDMWAEFRRRIYRGVKEMAPEATPPYVEQVRAFGEQRVGE